MWAPSKYPQDLEIFFSEKWFSYSIWSPLNDLKTSGYVHLVGYLQTTSKKFHLVNSKQKKKKSSCKKNNTQKFISLFWFFYTSFFLLLRTVPISTLSHSTSNFIFFFAYFWSLINKVKDMIAFITALQQLCCMLWSARRNKNKNCIQRGEKKLAKVERNKHKRCR